MGGPHRKQKYIYYITYTRLHNLATCQQDLGRHSSNQSIPISDHLTVYCLLGIISYKCT